MSTRGRDFGRAACLALLVIGLDQLSKGLIRTEVMPGERVDVLAGVEIVRVANRGIAFGLLDEAGSLILVLAAVAFASLLGMFLAGSDRRGLWVPIGLLAGGAVGNLIDRIREGAVTDFVDLGSWPAFNVADVAITFGVVILVWMYAFGAEPRAEDGYGVDEGDEPPAAEPGSR